MGYAVELLLDDSDQIRELFAANRSPMVELGGSPHVSLAVFDNVEVAKLAGVVERFSWETTPFGIRFQSIGLFPSASNVVFLAPVVTRALLEMHRIFHELLSQAGLMSDPLYLPDAWVPHCSIAFEMPMNRTLETIRAIAANAPHQEFTVSRVELVRFRPVEVLADFKLAAGGSEIG